MLSHPERALRESQLGKGESDDIIKLDKNQKLSIAKQLEARVEQGNTSKTKTLLQNQKQTSKPTALFGRVSGRSRDGKVFVCLERGPMSLEEFVMTKSLVRAQ